VDPLAVKTVQWSVYNYLFNNPVMLVDPDGRNPTPGFMFAMQAAFDATMAMFKNLKDKINSSYSPNAPFIIPLIN
jgi:hypothetical protein